MAKKKVKGKGAEAAGEKEKLKARSVYLTSEEWRAVQLKAIEEGDGVRYTDIVRRALRKYLKLPALP